MRELSLNEEQKSIFHPILISLFVILIYSLSIHQIICNDLFWHIKTGEYIVANKSVPMTDPFSYTIEGKSWLSNQWLSDILLYTIHKFFNFNGLILFKATLISIVFLIMLSAFFKRNAYSWLYILIASAAVFCSNNRFILRPDNFTLFFTSLYIYIFTMSGNKTACGCQQGVTKKNNYLFALPFLQILWVNTHGGFIIGLLLTGLFLIEEIFETKVLPLFLRMNSTCNSRLRLQRAFLLAGAVLCASFISPFGPKIILYPFKLVGSKFFQGSVLEWLSIFSVINLKIETICLFIFLSVIAIISFLLNLRRIRIFNLLYCIVFGFLAVYSRRYIPLFAIGSTICFGLNITDVFDKVSFNVKRSLLKISSFANISVVFLLCAAIFFVITNRYYRKIEVPKDFGLGIAENLQPIDACKFIKENKIKGRMFNSYDFGAYLIYALYPEHKVFMDGRVDTYGEDFYVNEYQVFINGGPQEAARLAEKYNINFFVLKIGMENPLMTHILRSHQYEIVYFDAASVILLKRTEENKPVLDKYAIDISNNENLRLYDLKFNSNKDVNLYGFDWLYILFKNFISRRAFPIKEYNLGNFYSGLGAVELSERHFKRGIEKFPEYKTMRYCLGDLYFRNNRFKEAIEAYSAVLKYDKNDYMIHKVLGDVYIRINDFKKACSEYERVLEIEPNYDINIYRTLGALYQYYFNDAKKAEIYYSEYKKRHML